MHVRSGPQTGVTVTAMRRVVMCLMTAVYVAGLSACVFPEAEFNLADSSALSHWFTLPEGQTRRDVSVVYSLYGYNSGKTRMRMYDARRRLLSEVWPTIEARVSKAQLGVPVTGDQTLDRYPGYTVLALGTDREVVEHRQMEPVFYVVTDPELVARVLTAAGLSAGTAAAAK